MGQRTAPVQTDQSSTAIIVDMSHVHNQQQRHVKLAMQSCVQHTTMSMHTNTSLGGYYWAGLQTN